MYDDVRGRSQSRCCDLGATSQSILPAQHITLLRLGEEVGRRLLVPLQLQSPDCPVRIPSSRDTAPQQPRRCVSAFPVRQMAASATDADAGAGLRSEFLQVLLSRRRDLQVPLSVEQGSPVKDPMYQNPPSTMEANPMESCPSKDVENLREKLVEENFYLITELGEQGRVPVLLLKLDDPVPRRKPAIVFLHSSYKCKEWLRPLLEAYASKGYVCVAIDSRYHGERASNETTYIEVWDLVKLGDYLGEREDVDPCRVGITGESLGEAGIDLGKSELDTEVVEKVWEKIAPGLDSQFDAPYSLPLLAPRPLLLLNGTPSFTK
ncbi:hypothetical protein Zm00014a_003181 [Zea mays]|uniref:Alpha/beta-Hydrolases superfamily protein n=1 Tax=Zea mays TaxID=4577 RepID=A0A3L6E5F7_MAIZE|nr:hypothetical protein Zm00014a_003181 [Zea mays]